MHASSYENMQKCRDRFLSRDWMRQRQVISVLDVGGADVNGTYADLFPAPRFEYVAADIAPEPNVQLELEDAYALPRDDESIDLVISGQTFEHVEFFWELFREMARVVKPDGFVFLIAPSAGPEHRYPVDCYRFYPDAYAGLAKYTGMRLIDCWRDERGPWNDLVGVFSKTIDARPRRRSLRDWAAPTPGSHPDSRHSDEWNDTQRGSTTEADSRIETTRGDQPYRELLASVHATLQPRFYLEIGVRHGGSLALASCPSVGVDPDPDAAAFAIEQAKIYRETSDSFFELDADSAIAGRPLDLAFIDGMHRVEYALRDFMNVERLSQPSSVIVIDDIFPNHPVQAARSRRSRVWTGDVWKLYHCLKTRRPDLELFPLDVSPTGLLVVGNPDRRNRSLWERYNPLVREYRNMRLRDAEALILRREHARPPTDTRLREFLRRARLARDSGAR